ncbi:MAG TPA: hypothetical protein VMS01_04080 [Stellaceae bacterium]|nr:hypothetical protein [Stellaceae bacterium]
MSATRPDDHPDLGPRVQVVTDAGTYGCWASTAHPMSSYGLPVLIRPTPARNGAATEAAWDVAYRPGDFLAMVNRDCRPGREVAAIKHAVVLWGGAEMQRALAAAGYQTLANCPSDLRAEVLAAYPGADYDMIHG